MPDVCRSDSQRSDNSQRPRVSFNRDVHVKRISSSGSPRVALVGDGSGRLVAHPVRRLTPRDQLAREAATVLRQAGRADCAATTVSVGDGFSSLRLPSRRARGKPSKALSTSLTDLSSEPERPKRRKEAAAVSGSKLKRSQSERSSERPRRDPLSAAFQSLERKRHKGKLKDEEDTPPRRRRHSDLSDRSSSPRKQILKKKSSSDSEARPDAPPAKKQLSPIIEDAPRAGYFPPADAMESNRRGGSTVETLVRRLSQHEPGPRRPVRGLSPSALVAPAAGRSHNNNLPFSYTQPPLDNRFQPQQQEGPPPPQQVIYAEVVVSGSGAGKQTVHTKVPAAAPAAVSDDEGVSLSMDYAARRHGGLDGATERREISYSGATPDGGYRKEYLLQEASRYEDYNSLDSSGRGRADGMDARRKDFLIESAGRYNGDMGVSPYRNGDIFDSPIRKTFADEGKLEYSSSTMYRDSVDSGAFFESSSPLRKEAPLASDLSSRRDRLESRIESQRKERFVSTGNSRKYATDPPRKTVNDNRREFLNSQIGEPDVVRYENDRNRAKSSRYTEEQVTTKKDFFADSGIEVDYQHHQAVRTIDGPTAKIIIGGGRPDDHSPPPGISASSTAANVTRVDLRTPPRDEDLGHHSGAAFSSTRLVQEHRKAADVLPASTVLIRHYAPNEERSREPSPRHREVREARHMEHRELHEHKEFSSRTLSRTQREQRDSERLVRSEQQQRAAEASAGEEEQRRRRRRRRDEKSKSRSDDEEETGAADSEDDRDTIKRGGTLRPEDGKPHKKGPAPAPPDSKKKDAKKKSGPSAMDRVKQLFGGSSKKDKKKKKEESGRQAEEDDPVSARYTEYRGENVDTTLETDEETLRATPHSTRRRLSSDAEDKQTPRATRQRLATPSPSPAPSHKENGSSGWFKSLDRLGARKGSSSRNRDKSDVDTGVTEDELSPSRPLHSTPAGKNLRFFGDTDAESVISIPPPAAPISRRYKTNSALHASGKPTPTLLQVPTSTGSGSSPSGGHLKASSSRRHHRSAGDVATSSAESTTEGDSSQQSQRSVVYLHAATVGDIPGPPSTRSQGIGRRAQSREELSSVTSSHLQPQTKTISRSISVLAPWRPKHYKEGMEVHYTNEDNNRNYIKNGKPPKAPTPSSQQNGSSTVNRAVSRRKSGGDAATKQKVNKAMSIESLSHKNSPSGGVRHTLEMRNSAKKKAAALNSAASVESLSRRERSSSKKNSALNASAMELSGNNRNHKGSHKKEVNGLKDSSKVSRSASMPKDTRVTAGWFKLRNKKQGT